jgi:hypothetical protein
MRTTMTSEAKEGVEAALRNLADTSLVVRWVVVAEIVDASGERALWTEANDDCKAWESVGLLQFALMREQAAFREDEEE